MHKAKKTKDRPEQLLIKEILEYHTNSSILETEKTVTYMTEFNDQKEARLDIFMVLDDKEFAIRVMGPAHDRKIRKQKDSIQKDYLQREGYVVIDIWYHENEVTFKRNKRKLKESELLQAFNEMIVMFGDLMEELPNKQWLLNSEHKK